MSGGDWDANFFCKEKSIDRSPIYVQSYDTNALSTNVLSRTNPKKRTTTNFAWRAWDDTKFIRDCLILSWWFPDIPIGNLAQFSIRDKI
eukprot:scaffold435_cov275-Chaetoceros_neogracile.AAC.28